MAKLRARKIHGDDRYGVVLVESVDIRQEKRGGVLGLLAWSKPFAVVILAASGVRAIGMDAKPLDVDSLLDNAEGLSALLER